MSGLAEGVTEQVEIDVEAPEAPTQETILDLMESLSKMHPAQKSLMGPWFGILFQRPPSPPPPLDGYEAVSSSEV